MLLEIFFTMTTLAPYDPEIFSDPSPMATSGPDTADHLDIITSWSRLLADDGDT
jgi:hypothetical protein